MWEKEFDDSANIISDEMCKWSGDKGSNFGFITDNKGNYRIFCGGDVVKIADGIASGIVQLMANIGDKDGDLLVDVIGYATCLIEKERKRVLQ